MKRHLQLRQSFIADRYDQRSWAIRVPIETAEVPSLCCELVLLLYGKADRLVLKGVHSQKLALTCGGDQSSATGQNPLSIPVNLSRRDLEFLLGFLVTWYRDGMAEVNHVDIQLQGDDVAGEDCMLVVEALSSQPPLTANEIEKLLRG